MQPAGRNFTAKNFHGRALGVLQKSCNVLYEGSTFLSKQMGGIKAFWDIDVWEPSIKVCMTWFIIDNNANFKRERGTLRRTREARSSWAIIILSPTEDMTQKFHRLPSSSLSSDPIAAPTAKKCGKCFAEKRTTGEKQCQWNRAPREGKRKGIVEGSSTDRWRADQKKEKLWLTFRWPSFGNSPAGFRSERARSPWAVRPARQKATRHNRQSGKLTKFQRVCLQGT